MSGLVKRPRSLRAAWGISIENRVAKGSATVGALLAVGAATDASAQAPDAGLPPVTVDAPIARPRPVAARPSQAQKRARTAIRQRARQANPALAAPVPTQGGAGQLPTFAREGDYNPYANPGAPYKADRLSGTKFSEPILNTPRTVTVLTKELLQDKNATSLKEVARTTNGITIGTGEGGNAFGDRFFIRGFDARNDVFVDGVRDPGVSIRENFFTEQIEILRGPGSTFAGRGIAGGAINIVTKQAGDKDFVKADLQGGITSDHIQRFTIDMNKVVSPDFSVRVVGMEQTAGIAGRDYTTDDRWGLGVAFKATPTDNFKISGNFFHTDFDGIPDFGVPLYRGVNASGQIIGNLRPLTETYLPRETFYGFVNRDFQRARQDIGTLKGEVQVNDYLSVVNTFRAEGSVLDYVGTLPQVSANGATYALPNPASWMLNASPQSRYQTTDVLANQTDAIWRFQTGDIRHTLVTGVEIDRETLVRQNYAGFNSELNGASATSNGIMQSILYPNALRVFATQPAKSGNKSYIPVDTHSVYAIETANWNDIVIVNGGVRFDNYNVSVRTTAGATAQVESNMVNWNAGLVVKPLPFLSLYGAVATSSNPVGAELDASGTDYGGLIANANINQALPPEENIAYEAGAKAELMDGRLLLTGAAFETVKDKAREMINSTTIGATGRYSIAGGDFGVTGKITDRWSIYAGYTIFNTKVDRSFNPANVGLRLANTAAESFTLFTKYKFNDWFEAGGQAVYRSKIYGGTFAANPNVLPDFWRFDAFAEIKASENWKLTANVQNIFDKTYYDAFYRSTVPFAFVAPGRTVTVTASAKF